MQEIAATLLQYKYLGLLPLAMAEGPVIALVAGFLVHEQVLNAWFAFGTLVVGDLIPDAFFYCLGHYGADTRLAKRFLAKSTLFTEHLDAVARLWERHPRKTMFFGKLAYGLGLPVLTSTGLVRMPFARFVGYAVPVTLLQYGVIMAIGYGLGSSYGLAKNYVTTAYVVTALGVVLFVAGYVVFAKYARKRILAIGETESEPRRRDGA